MYAAMMSGDASLYEAGVQRERRPLLGGSR
jgi:hypothetical protein